MSVQAVSRIAALLALDAELLRDYVPKFADPDADNDQEEDLDYDPDEDLNEANRANLAHLYRHQLTEDEGQLIADGDANEILRYIADHLEKPVNGESAGGGG